MMEGMAWREILRRNKNYRHKCVVCGKKATRLPPTLMLSVPKNIGGSELPTLIVKTQFLCVMPKGGACVQKVVGDIESKNLTKYPAGAYVPYPLQ